MRAIMVASTLIAALIGIPTARAGGDVDGVSSCPAAGSTWDGSNPWCYPWQTSNDWLQRTVSVPSPADGKDLAGTLFRPVRAKADAELPAVAILHGLGGKEQSVWWLARYLAGRGYVALTVTTAGNNAANFSNAMQAMADYLRSPDNPYAAYIDVARVGAAGHSAGARAASWVQDADFTHADHVKTIVALDNLTSDLQGDSGNYLLAPQCTASQLAGRPVYTSGLTSGPITPRVPALGLASDDNSVTCPERNVLPDPYAKEAAWNKWRAAGLDALELVLKGTNHLSFDQDGSRTFTGDAHLQLIGELTQSWFDAYLLGRTAALEQLLGVDLFGVGRSAQLSTQFHSGAFVPALGLNCDRFEQVTTCPPRPGHG
jgi:hypothetical protein